MSSDMKSWVSPVVSVIFVAGIAYGTLEATAEETEQLNGRVSSLEQSVKNQEIIDLKIEGVEKRLDKMEELQSQMMALQQQQAINMAAVCQATNADCSR